jgi:hypothetical protein
MTYDWDDLRPQIIDLYIGRNLTLDEVARVINTKNGLDIRSRTFREKLKEWGMRKVDHRGRRKSRCSTFSTDSGYADSGYASYPTLSRTTSISAASWQASTATLTPSVQSLAPSARSRPSDDLPRRASAPFLSSHSYSKHEKWKPLPPIPQQAPGETETILHGRSVPVSTPTPTGLVEPPKVPAHPPGSECSWAKRVENVARIAIVGKCSECGASILHSVAAGGRSVVQDNFQFGQQVQSLHQLARHFW